MTEPLVTPDLDFSLDVLCDIAAQISLDLVIRIDELPDTQHFRIREVTYLRIRVDLERVEDLLRAGYSDPEDIGESHLNALFSGEIGTCDSSHCYP